MHARSGLRTRYFSGEWFEAVKACIEEAAKLGMEPWLYDENGWPSGFGNGGVNGLGEKYRQKYLRMTKGEAPRNPICRVGEISFYYDVNPYYVDTLDASVTAEFIRQVYQVYRDTLPPEIWRSVKGFFTDEPQISRDGIPWSLTLPIRARSFRGSARTVCGSSRVPQYKSPLLGACDASFHGSFSEAAS